LAKWGRRGKHLINQSKGDYLTEAIAIQHQQNLWREQLKGGYLDIESDEYRRHMAITMPQMTPLTMTSPGIQENLEQDDGTSQAAPSIKETTWQCERCGKKYKVLNAHGQENNKAFCPECVQKVKEKAKAGRKPGEEDVLVCIDNSGIEDRFDVGIEYLYEVYLLSGDPMVYVYDKMGRKDVYFKARFVTPEQWWKKQGKIKFKILKNREPKPGEPKMEFKEIKPGDKIELMNPIDTRNHFAHNVSSATGFSRQL